MTKNDVLDYVMTTPHNTNRAVLSSILDSYVSSDNKQEIEFLGTENGVFTPKEGKVFNKVTVNVPIPVEIELSATENTIYTPDEGKVYKKVTVNVPAPAPGSECEILEFTVEELGYNSAKTVAEIIADNETTPQAIKFTSSCWFEEGYVQGNTIYKLIRIDEGESASGLTFGAIEMLINGSASETIVARGRSNNQPLSLTLMA